MFLERGAVEGGGYGSELTATLFSDCLGWGEGVKLTALNSSVDCCKLQYGM